MSVFNKIKFEILILFILTFFTFISFYLDFTLFRYFQINSDYLSGKYLKEFFVAITELGNSAWYFSLSIFFGLLFYVIKKIKIIKLKKIDALISFFISSFICLLIVGVVTQIFKHLIGRARPNYTNFDEGFVFDFFTFNSSYHSFPSGHSSTIFMVCLIFCAVLPKLKYCFLFMALIIALSRVVVGAHFLSDVIAGGLLSYVVFKMINNFFNNKFTNLTFTKLTFQQNRELYYVIILFSLASLFLTVGPTLDMYISGLFLGSDSKFLLQNYDILSIIFRKVLLPILLAYMLIVPIISYVFKIDKVYFGHKFLAKEIFFIWFSQIVTMLIFVNLILKNFWGRARPGDVVGLGGVDYFTPWYEYSVSCNTNCSFVSGDASVGFSVIILYLITKNIVFFYISIVSGMVIGLVRIIEGGHFLSDVLFAGIVIIILNSLLFALYKKNYE